MQPPQHPAPSSLAVADRCPQLAHRTWPEARNLSIQTRCINFAREGQAVDVLNREGVRICAR
eukprot:9176029-Alexandrium_andersonii.AAC.1